MKRQILLHHVLSIHVNASSVYTYNRVCFWAFEFKLHFQLYTLFSYFYIFYDSHIFQSIIQKTYWYYSKTCENQNNVSSSSSIKHLHHFLFSSKFVIPRPLSFWNQSCINRMSQIKQNILSGVTGHMHSHRIFFFYQTTASTVFL